jgi:hypothetical protein
MSTGAIVGIIIAVLVVAAIVVLGPALLRQTRMRRQFGPEYDRLAKELGPRKAAAELTARQSRVEALGIHPLSAEQQASYDGDWTAVQKRFVDAPAEAVSAADALIWDVMRDRGYPADNHDASMEALSVYHARPLDGYRQAQDVQLESASTEELRTALIRYRALFQELVGDPVGQRMFGRRAAATAGPAPDPATEPDAASNGRTRKIAIVPPKTAGTPR